MYTAEQIERIRCDAANVPCSCGRVGRHLVCPNCGKCYPHDTPYRSVPVVSRPGRMRSVLACDCVHPSDGAAPELVSREGGKLSAWDNEFLLSIACQLESKRRPLSEKQLAALAKVIARVTSTSERTTRDADAIDLSPKRGRTWGAMVRAMTFTPVEVRGDGCCPTCGLSFPDDRATRCAGKGCAGVRSFYVVRPLDAPEPTREAIATVRAEVRRIVSDELGWTDKLATERAFLEAAAKLPEKLPIAKCLAQLLDYHRFMVATGRFVEPPKDADGFDVALFSERGAA